MLTFEDLFQQPYHFHSTPVAIHPRLAAEISYLLRQSDDPVYRYETLMLERVQDYGPGLKESGRNYGFGASFTDPAEALVKSVFEAWERKFSKTYDATELVTGPYSVLGEHAVSPTAFTLISDWEYRQSPLEYVRYSPKLPLSWRKCYQVTPGALQAVLIPATLVYTRYGWQNPAERFAPNLSPGLACHFTFRDSFLAGLYELMERDAFMLAWLHRRSPPRIRSETVELAEAERAHRHLVDLGFLLHFVDLTSDLEVPVVLTLIEHPDLPWEGTLVLGLGCALNPHEALRKSLLEAIAMLANHVTVATTRSEMTVQRRTLPFGLQSAEYFRTVRFLLESEQSIAIQEIPNHDRQDSGRNLELLIRHLNGRGHATYFVDLTPDGYEGCRLCLTRAFIADLQPMLYEPDCWRLNPRRLFGQARPAFERLNLMPHPLMLME